ncbi:transcriptional regulator, LuxR family [Caldicellulosiruptor kronotskyensis 2002]|uniref:Transcriptional regulator, LuxR family n=1 Tax=Caldicellulosiruptor kronotskyensis (strain DSM 18902 / VKM B-2412 / 2002) TaxID=632348 RepID=E4SCH3_CALK2|nr:transcriptional regulator, LuxR family [Caldicellulosiruptor kronotskyensis 2002]
MGISAVNNSELTKREKEIIKLIAKGYSNKEISSFLNISEGTVKTYIKIIMLKLNARSRVEIAAYYFQNIDKFKE